MQHTDSVLIPKDRINIIIGTASQTRKQIEKRSNCKIHIDTQNNEVQISGEPFDVWVTKRAIEAIGRGFSPDIAFLLFQDNYGLEILNIKDYAGSSKASLQRIKARIIGTQGSARKLLEQKTSCHISIYGKTVSVIGPLEHLKLATSAINRLLAGAKHSGVYVMIEKQRTNRSIN